MMSCKIPEISMKIIVDGIAKIRPNIVASMTSRPKKISPFSVIKKAVEGFGFASE